MACFLPRGALENGFFWRGGSQPTYCNRTRLFSGLAVELVFKYLCQQLGMIFIRKGHLDDK